MKLGIGLISIGIVCLLIGGYLYEGWFNKEPLEHQTIRNQIQVYSQTYSNDPLEWYPLRTVYSKELGQMTTTYWLFSKGKQTKGDIAAFVEIYNPEDTSWNKRNFSEMIVEFTRFDWATTTIITPTQSFSLPQVTQDNSPSLGYLTFRVTLTLHNPP